MSRDRGTLEPGERLADVICPQCKRAFRLLWNDYTKIEGTSGRRTLFVYNCPSGGVYRIEICCPHCDYVEEL